MLECRKFDDIESGINASGCISVTGRMAHAAGFVTQYGPIRRLAPASWRAVLRLRISTPAPKASIMYRAYRRQ